MVLAGHKAVLAQADSLGLDDLEVGKGMTSVYRVLPTRIANALRRANICYHEQAMALTDEELLCIRNLGKSAVIAIRNPDVRHELPVFTERQLQAITLVRDHKYTYRQAAKIMGVTQTRVSQLYHGAKWKQYLVQSIEASQ